MVDQPRPRHVRRADVLATLSAPVCDAWVATAGADQPYLVPLTLAWHDERIVLATEVGSPTGRNLAATGRARLGLGGTRDVVLIEATLEVAIAVTDLQAAAVGEAYAQQSDWDPRTAGPSYSFFVLRPQLIQAWRELNEIPGRTVLRDGSWLD